MNTHEFARSLNILARALRAGPKLELDRLNELIGYKSGTKLGSDEIRIGLDHLVALSRVDKKKWVELISEYNFPIKIRPRDASRDILGKLLRYLEKTPEARKLLRRSTPSDKASPELMKALASLLRE